MTTASWFTQWQFSWFALALVLVLGVGYVAAWTKARRLDVATKPWWLVAYLGMGMAVLVYALLGPIAAMSHRYLWVYALQLALLTAVIPTGIALGRPVAVIATAARSERSARVFTGRVARILMYPFVSSVLAMVSLILVFFTHYGQSALDSSLVHALLVAHLLFVGLLVVLPLLADEMLPGWATPGVCVLLACVDGLFDAIPGILVMTHHSLLIPGFPGFGLPTSVRGDVSASLDQKFAGGALLAVAETVGLPLLGACFVEWLRADRVSAKQADDELDARFGAGPSETTPWWLDDSGA